MSSRQNDSIEISLREILWKLLEQWRAVVIFGIIIGLLCCAFMYKKDVSEWQAHVNEQAALQEALAQTADKEDNPYYEGRNLIWEQLAPLPEDDQGIVVDLLMMRSSLARQQEYNKNSLLMNIDPSNEHVLRISYEILPAEGYEGSLLTLTSAYENMLPDELTGPLAESLNGEIEEKYARELIRVFVSDRQEQPDSGESTSVSPAVMTVDMILPEQTETEELKNQVDKAVTGLAGTLSGQIGQHTVRVFYSEDFFETDKDLMAVQLDVANQIGMLNRYIDNLEETLTAEQKTAYQKVLQLQAASAADTGPDNPAVAPKPGVSKRWFAVGFIIGIILYAILYVIFVILIRRIRTMAEITSGWNARILGEICEYDKKGLCRLFSSKTVYRFRHRAKIDIAVQLKETKSSIANLCGHRKISRLSVVPAVGSGIAEKCAGWRSLKQNLAGVTAENFPAVSLQEAVQSGKKIDETQILNADGVIIAVFIGKTDPVLIDQLIAVANDYDVPVLGTILIRG